MVLSKKKLSTLSKVETLENIKSSKILPTYAIVPSNFIFTKKKYLKNKKIIIEQIKQKFKKKFIIRSSSRLEDNCDFTNAGKFESYVVKKFVENDVNEKIQKIIIKFKNDQDQIFIQNFIENVDLSGVIFTRDPNLNSPYYVINYDKSGKTNVITSGAQEKTERTSITVKSNYKLNKKFIKLIYLAKILENYFKSDSLDIEFAKKGNKWYLFQCRKLPIRKSIIKDDSIYISLNNLFKKIIKIKKKLPNLYGSTTYLSNMSDWNPAEMIGVKPKPLGISLYSELITNKVWAQQRKKYFYKDVSPNILMHNLGGSPYIDLRADFNSFLPEDLSPKFGKIYVNKYLNRINKYKNLHDKIEFKLIPTCYDFSLGNNANYPKQYIKCLKYLTHQFVNNGYKTLHNEISKNKQLLQKVKNINKSNLSHIQKIFFLVEETKEKGTLPFAGIARLAFVTTKILYSLKDRNLLSNKELAKIFNSVNSITKDINSDLKKLYQKKITKNKFFKKYGHIRPSTYSISSLNFIEGFKIYFQKDSYVLDKKSKKEFKFLNEKKINKLLKDEKINLNFKEFINFFRETVEAREFSKYIFTKGIDEIFNNLIKLGKEIKIKRDDLEYIDINLILAAYHNLSMLKLSNQLKKNIKDQKSSYSLLSKIKLPDFISNEKDIYNYEITAANGNFIGDKKLVGKTVLISNLKKIKKIQNKIVFIENADPGYDFIFSHNIKGLITKYGGANSHMALRCLELKIPAVIGIGIREFEFYKNKNLLEIDCIEKKIKSI